MACSFALVCVREMESLIVVKMAKEGPKCMRHRLCVCSDQRELRGTVNHKPQGQFSVQVGFGVAQTPRKSCAAGAVWVPHASARGGAPGQREASSVSGTVLRVGLASLSSSSTRVGVVTPLESCLCISVNITSCVCFKCSRK